MEEFFRDATPRARWLRRLLWLLMGGHVVALAADVFERSVLTRVQSMDAGNKDALLAVAVQSDRWQLVVSVVVLSLLLAGYVISGMWIVRVARNVRALGARDLEISPGWSVGWYAIPFGNLFKPFQAMQDIWRASVSAAQWRQVATPGWLRIWWGCWLASNIIGQASLRLTLRSDGIDDLLTANAVSMIDGGVDIVLCAMFALVVARVTAAQNRQWQAGVFHVHDVPPSLGEPSAMAPPALPAG